MNRILVIAARLYLLALAIAIVALFWPHSGIVLLSAALVLGTLAAIVIALPESR